LYFLTLVCLRMCDCTHVCMYVLTCMYVHMYLCIHTYTYRQGSPLLTHLADDDMNRHFVSVIESCQTSANAHQHLHHVVNSHIHHTVPSISSSSSSSSSSSALASTSLGSLASRIPPSSPLVVRAAARPPRPPARYVYVCIYLCASACMYVDGTCCGETSKVTCKTSYVYVCVCVCVCVFLCLGTFLCGTTRRSSTQSDIL
jgi:hypothetical protein